MNNIIYESFNNLSLEQIEKFVELDVETYVCIDGNAKIYYKGDLTHCYAYSKMFRRYNSFELEIMSIELYNDMIEIIKKINE